MIDGLRPYADTKPTSLPWLGDVPAHWNVRRIKTLLREVDSRTKTGEERLLSLRMRQGLVDHIDAGGKLIPPESLVNFKIVDPGQVVMNRMRAAAGLFGVANVRGLVSPDYAVFEPMPEAFNPYLLQAFRLPSLSAVFRAESKGLGTGESGFLRLYTDRFGPIPVPYPPLDEQRLIVRFLDWHGAETAKLIRAKKKIIALLNEQKQAIIHRAVTRGLDPNVRLKPSGIPWLGDVPARWEVQRLGRLLDLTVGYAFKSSGFSAVDDDIRLLRGINVSPGKIRWQSVVRWPAESAKELSSFSLRVGDVVIGMDRPIIQSGIRIAWVSEIDVPSLLLQRVARVRFLSEIDEQFGFMILGGKGFIDYLTPIFSGISVPHISPQQISDFRFALPSIEEQKEIVGAINAQTRDIDKALNGVEREITLIQEFRTRLIADVVTGKLDVRAAAASLPEPAELEATDELVEDDDLDEAVDENEEVAA